MRRLLLLIIVFLNLSLLSAVADTEVTTTTASGQDQEVGIELPEDLEPGFHEVLVELQDPDTGAITEEVVAFCKDLLGEVHWDNQCEGLTAIADQSELENATSLDELPPYDPASEPGKTAGAAVAAFAALGAVAAGGASSSSGGSSEKSEANSEEAQELEGIDSGELKHIELEEGRGDRSRTWNLPFTSSIDAAFIGAAMRISSFSPILARVFIDGQYLRAIFGSVSVLIYPIAITLGFVSLFDVGAQAMPPHWSLLVLVMAVGVIDSLAGFIAASIFFIGVFVSGNMWGRNQLLTSIGILAISFAPALLASAFRPLRRHVQTQAEKWERATDYALVVLLTGWTVKNMSGALNGLAGKQLPITAYAFTIGVYAAAIVLLRVIGEDIATYLYPRRLSKLAPDLREPSKRQKVISLALKTFTFAFIAEPFVGHTVQLYMGAALFVLPSIVEMTVAESFPKSKIVHVMMPKGAFKLILMVFIGSFFAKFLQELIPNPVDFLKWGFVLFGIPGLILTFLNFFEDDENAKSWKETKLGSFIYRLGGLVILYAIVLMVLGKDLVSMIFGK